MTTRRAPKRSAGILVYRRRSASVEVLLGHPGGPFWSRRDTGAWSIPKGEYSTDEPAEDAARREFTEELGLPVPAGVLMPLGDVRQKNGKIVTAWAVEGDLDPTTVVPGTFELEWPPRSGRRQITPEIDRVAWFSLAEAADRINAAQRTFLDRVASLAALE